MLEGTRISEYDVRVIGPHPLLKAFVSALSKAGLRAWVLDPGIAQISFEGHPKLRAELPEIGTTYPIRRNGNDA